MDVGANCTIKFCVLLPIRSGSGCKEEIPNYQCLEIPNTKWPMSGFLKAFVPMAIVWPPRSKCLLEIENVNLTFIFLKCNNIVHVYCIVYSVQCTVYSVQCIVYSVWHMGRCMRLKSLSSFSLYFWHLGAPQFWTCGLTWNMKIMYCVGILIPKYHGVMMCFGSMVMVLKLPSPKYEKWSR